MRKTLLCMALLGLTACNSTPAPNSTPLAANDAIPQWVLLPVSDRGLAASACVPWSGNMAVDKAQAVAVARASLAQQIQLKAQVMDKMYMRRTDAEGATSSGGSFEQVSKQIADNSLVGSVPKEVAFAKLDNRKQLCVLVDMPATDKAFDNLVQQSGRKLNPMSKQALYEEFRAQKAQKELEAELDKLEN